jgi:hypothetical protein
VHWWSEKLHLFTLDHIKYVVCFPLIESKTGLPLYCRPSCVDNRWMGVIDRWKTFHRHPKSLPHLSQLAIVDRVVWVLQISIIKKSIPTLLQTLSPLFAPPLWFQQRQRIHLMLVKRYWVIIFILFRNFRLWGGEWNMQYARRDCMVTMGILVHVFTKLWKGDND